MHNFKTNDFKIWRKINFDAIVFLLTWTFPFWATLVTIDQHGKAK